MVPYPRLARNRSSAPLVLALDPLGYGVANLPVLAGYLAGGAVVYALGVLAGKPASLRRVWRGSNESE